MDSIYQTYRPSGGDDGLYLKTKDGDSIKLRIASEPAINTSEFTQPDGTTKEVTRFSWVVWNRDLKKAQVLSKGPSVYNQIADLFEEWNSPTTFDITLKHTGEMLNTEYSVIPSPKSVDLTKEEQAECDKIDLLKAVRGYWLKDFKDGGTPTPAPEDKVYDVDDDTDLSKIFPE